MTIQNSHRPSEPFSEPSDKSARSGRQAASAFAHSAGGIALLRSQEQGCGTRQRWARRQRALAQSPRAAERLPWEPTTVSLYRTIFPQMTNWLPEEEGAQLRFDFETELARLEAA